MVQQQKSQCSNDRKGSENKLTMQTTAEGLVQECKAVLGQHRELGEGGGVGGQ